MRNYLNIKPNFGTILGVSLITSLVIGFSDMIASILFVPRFHSLIYMFTPLAITFIFFLIFQLIVFPALAWMAKVFKSNGFLWIVSLAVYLTVFFLTGSAADLFAFTLTPERMVKALILSFLAAGMAILVYRELVNYSEKNTFHRWLITIAFALPFIFFEFLILAWHLTYKGTPLLSMSSVIALVIFVVMAALTLWFMDASPGFKIKYALVSGLALLVLAGLFVQPGSPMDVPFKSATPDRTKAKYIILITIDSLRRDALSCYNKDHDMTPNIDSLAKQSVVFNNAITQSSWTLPAIASLMTGMPPRVHQAHSYHQRISSRLPTLAGQLKKAGYYTAAIGVNPNLTKHTDISNGFIYYDFYPKYSTGRSFGSKIRKHLIHYIPDEKLTDVHAEPLNLDLNSIISTSRLTDLAIRWTTANREKPYFFWVHYFDPHVPYAPPVQFMKGKKPVPSIGYKFDRPDDLLTGALVPDERVRFWIKELYNGEVRYIDHSLGRLFASLKETDIYDNALIVLTSDHGEEFWDHGGYYHGHSLYNELLAVPLLIKLPGNTTTTRIGTDIAVSLRQVMPTILDYCQLSLDKKTIYKPSLLPILTRKAEEYLPQPVYASAMRYGPEKIATYMENWKYIHTPLTLYDELYHITEDPTEKTNRASQQPETVQKTKELFKQYFKQTKKIIKMFKIEVFEKHQKKTNRTQTDNLKTLGYF